MFISLGTVIELTAEESQTMFTHLISQRKFYFIWAVTTPMLNALKITQTSELELKSFIGVHT